MKRRPPRRAFRAPLIPPAHRRRPRSTVTGAAIDPAGGGDTCAVTAEGAEYRWGSNTGGEIGDGTAGSNYSRDIPTRIVQ